MLSELIHPQRVSAAKPVEELETEEDADRAEGAFAAEIQTSMLMSNLDSLLDDAIRAKQKLAEESQSPDCRLVEECGYGFAWRRHGVISKFGAGDLGELFVWSTVDEMPIKHRQEALDALDEEAFAAEHYL